MLKSHAEDALTTAKQKSKNSFAISEYYPSSDGKHILKSGIIEVVEKAFK